MVKPSSDATAASSGWGKLQAVSFTSAELKELEGSLASITIQGDRLPPAVLQATGVEAPPKGSGSGRQ